MNSAVAVVVSIISTALSSPRTYESIGPPPIPRTPLLTTYPAVTVQMIVGVDEQSLEGDSDLQQVIIQVNSSHPVQDKANTLRDQIKEVLFSYSGTVLGRVVQGFTHVVDNDLYLDQTKIWQCATRFKASIEKP